MKSTIFDFFFMERESAYLGPIIKRYEEKGFRFVLNEMVRTIEPKGNGESLGKFDPMEFDSWLWGAYDYARL